MSGTATRKTPKFRNPPVVETVIGVQFPEFPGFRSIHFGLYWGKIKDRYPRFEDKPRLGVIHESFPPKPSLPEPRIMLSPAHFPQRVWYMADPDSELIQLQPDRYVCNWREREGEDYPSFERNCSVFLREYDGFCQFCREHNLEEPAVDLCEVTYINHIFPVQGESAIDLFAKVFTGLNWEQSHSWLPAPEEARFKRTYVINENLGRLHADASIRYQMDDNRQRPLLRFALTAHVNHRSQGEGKLADSLQIAHDWVVNGFAALTDSEIQNTRWGRIQ